MWFSGDLTVQAEQLDLTILMVSSDQNDSVILWCEEQPQSLLALLLLWVHPPPGPLWKMVIPIEVRSTRLGQSTFRRKRRQCALCMAPEGGLCPSLADSLA